MAVLDVVLDTVTGVQPLQGPADIPFGRLDQQMVMVPHQYIRMDDDAIALDQPFQQFDEMLPVAVRMEQRPPPQPPGRDMVPSARPVMS